MSYKSMKPVDAVKMLKFKLIEHLLEYVQEKHEDWIVEGDRLTFQPLPMWRKAVDLPFCNLST